MENMKNLASNFLTTFRLSKESLKIDEIEEWETDFYASQLGISKDRFKEILNFILSSKFKIKNTTNRIKQNSKRKGVQTI